MNNNIVRIYAMLVCFFTLMCGAIAAGFLLFNLIKLAAPDATIDPNRLRYLDSNEAFRNSPYARGAGGPAIARFPAPAPAPAAAEEPEELSDAEIEAMRLEQRELVYANHAFRARQGIILQSIIVLIGAGLFFVHWRLLRRLREG